MHVYAPVTRGDVCNSAGALVSHQHRSHGYKNPFRRATVDDSCPACDRDVWLSCKSVGSHRLQSKAVQASLPEWQHFLGSEEETALDDENDRKEVAKLGSQGWAQLRGIRGT